jgi:hypothetical protein
MATIPNWMNTPTGSQPQTDALVTHTNPMTGETFTAPSGGYTLNYNMLTSNPFGSMFGGNGGLGGGMAGGMASAPRNLTPATPAAPIDQGFYNSQIYKDFQNNPANMMAGSAMTYSPYFGQQTSDDGGARDRAYEQYLASIGKPVANQNNFTPAMFNMLNGGNSSGNMLGGAPSSGMGGTTTGLAADQNLINSMLGSYDPTPMANVVPQGGYGSIYAPNTVQPTAGVSNPNNFNFTPTPIGASGSYDTSDWASLLGGAYTGGLAGAAAGAGVNEAVGRLQALGQAGSQDYANLARTATQGIDFKPYTLTSALGTTQQTAPGVISQQLTPQQQANVNAAQQQQASLYGAAVPDTSGISQGAFTGAQSQLGQVGANQQDLAALRLGYGNAAQGMTGMLGGSTTGMADQLFQQQQAMRSPVQQRQQLELENRLRAQGRLGTSTAAYGGTPEQLAMAKAVQEQQAADAFNSMTQAEQMATSQQARALGLGSATSTLAQAQQALRQGDINAASGLFNIGAAAAQLPQQMQGQNIAQAGQLQAQALAPASQQLQQAQLAGNIGQQQSTSAYQAGGLFGQLAGAGLQERLTAESAAAATRTKQFDSILKSYASQGGKAGADAQAIQELVAKGVTLVGDVLMGKDGNILGKAVDFIGTTATAMWDSVSSGAAMASNEVGDLINTFGDVVEGGGEAISSAWDVVTSWWDDL